MSLSTQQHYISYQHYMRLCTLNHTLKCQALVLTQVASFCNILPIQFYFGFLTLTRTKEVPFFAETVLCANCLAAKGKKVCVGTIYEVQHSQAKKRGHTNANYVRFHVWFGVDGTEPQQYTFKQKYTPFAYTFLSNKTSRHRKFLSEINQS